MAQLVATFGNFDTRSVGKIVLISVITFYSLCALIGLHLQGLEVLVRRLCLLLCDAGQTCDRGAACLSLNLFTLLHVVFHQDYASCGLVGCAHAFVHLR